MFSLCLLYAFLKLLTVFDLFITPGTMFQATIASLQAQVKSGVVDPLLTHELEQLRNIRFVASCLLFFVHSVADPYVFGPPGSGSISQRYGSGSFYHQAKILLPLFDLISLKNYVNVHSKRNKQKNLWKTNLFFTASSMSMLKIAVSAFRIRIQIH
jgi:hypothetical protein